MNKAEFDKYADEYRALHARNIRMSGESPEYFAEYKIVDTAKLAKARGLGGQLKVLDFGSGIGNSIPFFAKHFPGAELTCIDVSERSLEVSQERFSGLAQYRTFDGVALPFADASFDVIFVACVFHHIPEENHVRLFRELRRVLGGNGMLVVFEHNPRNPLTVRAVKDCPFDENAVLIDAPVLASRIEAGGFERTKSTYRMFFPGSLRFLRFVEPFLGWLPLGAQYRVVGTKDAPA